MSAEGHVTTADPAIAARATTYHRFLVVVRYIVIFHLAAGAFYLVGFAAGGGWLGATVVAALVLWFGVYINRRIDRPGVAAAAANLLVTTPAESGNVLARQIADAEPAPARAVTESRAEIAAEESYARDPTGRWVVTVLFAILVALWLLVSAPTFAGILQAILGR